MTRLKSKLTPRLIFEDISIGIFFEKLLILFFWALEIPVVPITTAVLFNEAIFIFSNVDWGAVKSIKTFANLIEGVGFEWIRFED